MSISRLVLVAAIALAPSVHASPDAWAVLVVSPSGAYILDGNVVAPDKLAEALRARREREPQVMLMIETNRKLDPPERAAARAVEAAGFRSVTWTGYKEVEQRRKAEHNRKEWLFWGAIELAALLVCAPFALSARTRARARRIGFLGVWGAGVGIALAIGIYEDVRTGAGGLTTIYLMVYAVPYSLVVATCAAGLFGLRASMRSPPTPPR